MIGCSESSLASKDESTAAREKTKTTENEWEVSPLFMVEDYSMIGEEGRLGFIYDESEVTRLYPNKTQKYMWHFWGTDEDFEGNLKIVATNEDEKTSIIIAEGELAGENNGANRHFPSTISLPKSGIWKLDAYIGDKLFESIFFKVYENN